MSQNDPNKRSTMLTVFLVAILGVFILGFMILITGGFFLYVTLVVGVIALMGWAHYLVWGKLLTERTAGEREEHQLLERMREQELDKKRPH